jgi:SAM-dependent methyltransferase
MQTHRQLVEHFEIERELADKLKSSTKETRRTLYKDLYDELFRRVPHHPQLTEKASAEARRLSAARQVRFLLSIATSRPVFLEVGAGDCLTSLEMAKSASQVYAVDVSSEITAKINAPDNFQLLLSDGSSIDVPAQSVDLAFSNQLMEHLHPDDALEQLRNIHRALKRNGEYFCITPNRFSGPHDVSQHFAEVACGFHLREYCLGELLLLFNSAGFSEFHIFVGKDGLYVRVPLALCRAVELMVGALPRRVRKRVGKWAPVRLLLGIRLLAVKA